VVNILYVHGFGSKFDFDSEKVQTLQELGNVYGVNIDYTQPLSKTLAVCKHAINEYEIDLIVGTSMGGYTATMLGQMTNIPFVSINPARNPPVMLRKYLGTNVDHYGREYTMTEETLETYTEFPDQVSVNGLVLLDEDDELIDSGLTMRLLRNNYRVFMFPGGNHRFAHMKDALPMIEHYIIRGLD
jgi:predicted esterase YcpF (UPF0227 family)